MLISGGEYVQSQQSRPGTRTKHRGQARYNFTSSASMTVFRQKSTVSRSRFINSRTLPGQSCRDSFRSASGLIAGQGLAYCRLNRSRKYWANDAMKKKERLLRPRAEGVVRRT